MKNSLDYQLYVQRENSFYHEPYQREEDFYYLIVTGNTEQIEFNRKHYSAAPDGGKGRLSDNPVNNARYHMIINTALAARACEKAGLSHETAFTLSDLYIKKADKCGTVDEIRRLNDEMSLEYASLMKRQNQPLSPPMKKLVNYICDNLHKKITVEELADFAGYNRSYLSVLFKNETGMTLCQYINHKRIETACNMLKSTEFSIADISETLAFASQSHFCKLFRQEIGCTPAKYRKLT